MRIGWELRWPVLLLSLLAVLAWLQYRWTGQIQAAERQRMEASLRSSLRRFAADVDAELLQVFASFRVEARGEPGQSLREGWERLAVESSYPDLVSSVFRVTAEGSLERLEEDVRLASVPWPAELAGLREELGRRRALDNERKGTPWRRRGGPTRPPMPFPLLWGEPPAVAMPIGAPAPGRGGSFESSGFVLATLDSDVIQGELLPELAASHFGDDYDVVVIDGSGKTIFSNSSRTRLDDPDARGQLLSLGRFFGGREARRLPRELREAQREMGRSRWSLAVRHRAGSLDAEVERARRRNLAVSFGILGLLGASVVLVTASARRATELSNQKMEFVAGVSHELRTPVAVVRSAGQNLADGSVTDPASVKKYGALIDSEGRRLNELIEQVLELSGIHAHKRTFRPEPVAVESLVEDVLADAESLRSERGATLSARFDERELTVHGEPEALRRALGNVVMNALKHGGDGNAVEVRARREGSEVVLEVSDRGPGIPPEERGHLFEPFYRGGRARARQIAGSGLGLSLVDNVLREQGGRIELSASSDDGSRFTLTLPGVRPGAPSRTEES